MRVLTFPAEVDAIALKYLSPADTLYELSDAGWWLDQRRTGILGLPPKTGTLA